ncbi:helix-turn-helix transcriptional regulator [Desulfocurvibacter africanus]|uniref:LexA family transcriptional regulator n=1 Tax=Desulfocurvibacter africanus TaxID=873 RepID=UPI002FDA34E9
MEDQVPTSLPTSDAKDGTDFHSVFARMKEAVGASTDAELGAALGLKQQTVSAAKSKKQIPPAWITKIASEHGISADWLLFGESPMRRSVPGPGNVGFPMQVNQPCDPELVLVPKVKARLSAGTGSLETNSEIMGRFAFRSSWIRSKGNPESMVLMDVTGDSMSPTIEEGDATLIDQSQTDIYIGKIYAIGIDNEVFVKYVDRVPGKFILRSANKDYAPIPVDLTDESCNVRIIGRVVWWCREAR